MSATFPDNDPPVGQPDQKPVRGVVTLCMVACYLVRQFATGPVLRTEYADAVVSARSVSSEKRVFRVTLHLRAPQG